MTMRYEKPVVAVGGRPVMISIDQRVPGVSTTVGRSGFTQGLGLPLNSWHRGQDWTWRFTAAFIFGQT